jgi:uncharacterized damage-inducible protein DinB
MRLTLSALLFAGLALAQTPASAPPTVGSMYANQLKTIENELVPLVEAMPADKMEFAPTQGEFKGVRTFAAQAKHIGAVVYLVAAAAKGEAVPAAAGKGEDGPEDAKTRDQIAKYLKDAFAYARTAAQLLTAENQMQMGPSPFGQGQMARGAALNVAIWHSFDHYGQMVVYARMNGIIPPASRQ